MGDKLLLDDAQKESLALTTMRLMLQQYAEQHQIPFDEAFFSFSNSPAYSALFDYETEIWKEGPEYLKNIFEESLVTLNH